MHITARIAIKQLMQAAELRLRCYYFWMDDYTMFYKDLSKGFALAIIDEIIEETECSTKAAYLIELFIGGLITVEEISMILE